MTLPVGHYRVTIGNGALRTAFHLGEEPTRVRILREDRGELRAIGAALGVPANIGLVLGLVMSAIGAGIGELGGSAPDALMISAGVGALVGVLFGVPALALALLRDTWAVHAF